MMDWRDKHPSAAIHTKPLLWFGPEVEGSLRGEHTAFLAGPIGGAALITLAATPCTQVFLTETFDDYPWLEHNFAILQPLHGVITMGRMPHQLEDFLAFRLRTGFQLNVVVRQFNAAWVHLLIRYDQISIGVPYHMRTFTIGSGVLTVPHDYTEDVT